MIMKNQKGASILGIIVFVAIIALSVTYGFKIASAIIDKNSVQRIAKTALTEAKESGSSGLQEIKTSITKKTQVNNISLSSDDIVVQRISDNVYSVDIDYSKDVPITKNIKVVIQYNISEKTE